MGMKSVYSCRRGMYLTRQENCVVEWVSKVPGARGSIYSVRLRCCDPAGNAGKRISSNLIIWPKDTKEIAVGPEFSSLVSFRRWARGECPRDGDPNVKQAW